MWPVTQPVLLSRRRRTGDVVSRYPKEWPGQRPSSGEFQETDWAGQTSSLLMGLWTFTRMRTVSIRCCYLGCRNAVGKSEQGLVLVALTTSSQNGKLNSL